MHRWKLWMDKRLVETTDTGKVEEHCKVREAATADSVRNLKNLIYTLRLDELDINKNSFQNSELSTYLTLREDGSALRSTQNEKKFDGWNMLTTQTLLRSLSFPIWRNWSHDRIPRCMALAYGLALLLYFVREGRAAGEGSPRRSHKEWSVA